MSSRTADPLTWPLCSSCPQSRPLHHPAGWPAGRRGAIPASTTQQTHGQFQLIPVKNWWLFVVHRSPMTLYSVVRYSLRRQGESPHSKIPVVPPVTINELAGSGARAVLARCPRWCPWVRHCWTSDLWLIPAVTSAWRWERAATNGALVVLGVD